MFRCLLLDALADCVELDVEDDDDVEELELQAATMSAAAARAAPRRQYRGGEGISSTARLLVPAHREVPVSRCLKGMSRTDPGRMWRQGRPRLAGLWPSKPFPGPVPP